MDCSLVFVPRFYKVSFSDGDVLYYRTSKDFLGFVEFLFTFASDSRILCVQCLKWIRSSVQYIEV